MAHRTNEFMLNLLKDVQPLQIEAVKKGYSAHLDINTTDIWDDGPHDYFDLTIFDGNEIIDRYDFSHLDTEEQLQAQLAKLRADINAL